MGELPPLARYECRCTLGFTTDLFATRTTQGRLVVARGRTRGAEQDALRKHAIDLVGPPPLGFLREYIGLTWEEAEPALSFRLVDREAP